MILGLKEINKSTASTDEAKTNETKKEAVTPPKSPTKATVSSQPALFGSVSVVSSAPKVNQPRKLSLHV